MWLTGRLAPHFKTIADFPRYNGKAIRSVCRQLVVLCRNLNFFSQSIIAIDGSKFKAVNMAEIMTRLGEQLQTGAGYQFRQPLANRDRAD